MFVAVPLGNRCGWMSADGRINYTRSGTGWKVTARSEKRGGQSGDQTILRKARIVNIDGNPHVDYPTREQAVAAVVAAFDGGAVGLTPPSVDIRIRPIAYKISCQRGWRLKGIESFKVIKQRNGWFLRGVPLSIDELRQYLNKQSTGVHISFKHEWEEVCSTPYPTRQAALEDLLMWFDSYGVQPQAMTTV